MTSLVRGPRAGDIAAAGMAAAGWVCRGKRCASVQPARTPGPERSAGAPEGTEGGWLTASDGTRLRYWFVPAAGGPRPTVVLIHGLLANRDTMLPRAVILARHGFAALVLELRAHGASGGAYTTLGQRETEDVSAALAYLATRAEVEPQARGAARSLARRDGRAAHRGGENSTSGGSGRERLHQRRGHRPGSDTGASADAGEPFTARCCG